MYYDNLEETYTFSKNIYLFILERGEGREKNIEVREKDRSAASHTHPDQAPCIFPDGDQTAT